MTTSAVIKKQSPAEKEKAIFDWKMRKGIISLSYVGSQAIFSEERYFGSLTTCRATTKSCDCQVARNGFVCSHIKYLRENVEF